MLATLRLPPPSSLADRLMLLLALAGIGAAALSIFAAVGRGPW